VAPKITEDAWIAEIARLSRKNDSGQTLDEWCRKLGKGRDSIRRLLMTAKQKGWLVIGQRTVEALDGRNMSTVVYRIVQKKQ